MAIAEWMRAFEFVFARGGARWMPGQGTPIRIGNDNYFQKRAGNKEILP